MGVNLTEEALQRASRYTSMLSAVCKQFDTESGVPVTTSEHKTINCNWYWINCDSSTMNGFRQPLQEKATKPSRIERKLQTGLKRRKTSWVSGEQLEKVNPVIQGLVMKIKYDSDSHQNSSSLVLKELSVTVTFPKTCTKWKIMWSNWHTN